MPNPDLAAQIAAVRREAEAWADPEREPAWNHTSFALAKHKDALRAALRTLEALADRDAMPEIVRLLILGKKAKMPWAELVRNNMPAALSAVDNWRRKAAQFRAALLARAGGGK